ncbi:hypothetical protein HO133_001123 [Letharia lupina]|uniref:DUF6536 domain-containing protein n=1 Tax=Letharia lupina TaxID=560253 RepID=A0A8H6FB71_9LECA|nr:uncharacterized protein HO133_001123 [Letharia lupina]KAF6222037.1 hypothetical protein HO133_001123 [Letharia lupina]
MSTKPRPWLPEPFVFPPIDFDPLRYEFETGSIDVTPDKIAEPCCDCSEGAPPLGFSRPTSPTSSTSGKATSEKDILRLPGHFQGWRMGVTLCAITTGTVLVINLIVITCVAAGDGLEGGLGTLQQGSCQKTKHLSLWLHLAINLLSTLLLGASNYTMQCLSSPTREEIDKAHRKRIWLDIGIPSLRNLRQIGRGRIVLWWSMALSSIPLHLLYNSVVFSTLSAQEYSVFAASAELVNGVAAQEFSANRTALNWTGPTNWTNTGPFDTMQHFQNASGWQKLDNRDCIKAYGQDYVSAHGDLLLISPAISASEMIVSLVYGPGNGLGNTWWMCDISEQTFSNDCSVNAVADRAANWTINCEINDELTTNQTTHDQIQQYNCPVQYCFSQPVEEQCRVQVSLVILGIVIACNATKALCMLLTIRNQKSQPLVTLGDAIQSFLQEPDPSTEGMCLASKAHFNDARMTKVSMSQNRGLRRLWQKTNSNKTQWIDKPMEWSNRRHWWFSSASLKRWLVCNILCVATLGAAGGCLALGIGNPNLTDRSLAYLWQLGYGTVASESMISWSLPGTGGLLVAILVANSLQVLLSFLYLAYNGVFTCMLLANEWAGYAYSRKSLRVTSPTGSQRSTYRLQLPYKYGVPLLVLSGILHWLVSQSIFLARISAFTSEGVVDPGESISNIGYSNIAIITVIALGTIAVLLGILNGFRIFRPVARHRTRRTFTGKGFD